MTHENKEQKAARHTGEPARLRKGTALELQIESLAFGGRGLAKVDGMAVFVDGAVPGQTVRARISRTRKAYAEARTLEVVKHSNEEVEPRCKHFGECGGCRLQNLSYDAQLRHKQSQVRESLEHLGGFRDQQVLPTIASPEQFYYRNKMEYSFGRLRWISAAELQSEELVKPRDFALGLHIRGRYDKILDLDECFLQSATSMEILACVRSVVSQSNLKPYSTSDHRGFWRHLMVREGKNTGELLLNIVTAEAKGGSRAVASLSERLVSDFPGITSVVHNINRGKADTAIGEEERVLHGPGFIKDRIGDRIYRISANSFFQTNTKGAERLYEEVARLCAPESEQVVFDLYSGAGTISLYLADKVRKVVGFELVESAVADAQANCHLNEVGNVDFVAGDLKESLTLQATTSAESVDAMVIDPPRAGMHPDVVNTVVDLAPARIVYVSCNPATFARDAKILCQAEYELVEVQPVDMFPMTPHIETVSLLLRKGG